MHLPLNKLLWSKEHIRLCSVAQTLNLELSPHPKVLGCDHRKVTWPLESGGHHLQNKDDSILLRDFSWELNEIMHYSTLQVPSIGVGKLYPWVRHCIANKVLLGHSHPMHGNVPGWWLLHNTIVGLSRCSRDHMAHKPKIITVWPCKKKFANLWFRT